MGFPQLKKRSLEAQLETSSSSMTSVAKSTKTTNDISDLKDDKRRKKSFDELKREADSPKQVLLPQKKRVLPNSATNSPAKKSQKTGQPVPSQDESAVSETLIRETEAALKNLSGSWPGPRGSSYGRQQEESPAFENLFEEKKGNPKLSPSSSSNSSSDNACSLKDVITLRDPHEDVDKSSKTKINKPVKVKQETELDNLIKIESECASIQAQTKTKGKQNKGNEPPSHYEPPDFNELVDDSSNELEIDMSEAAVDKDDVNDDKLDLKSKKKDSEDVKRSRYSSDEPAAQTQSVYHPFPRPVTSSVSPFSSTSAFRPPQTDSNKATSKPPVGLTPLGPYPEEATFVGYSATIGAPSSSSAAEDKLKSTVNIAQLKQEGGSQADSTTACANPDVKSSVASPEAMNKQYTILQPATAGSRAASALQEAAREGVPSVSAVSSSSSSTSSDSSAKMSSGYDRVTGALSPTSIGRGKLFELFIQSIKLVLSNYKK